MSVDLCIQIRIPLGFDDKNVERFFRSTNHGACWKPTKEYLNLFCSDKKLIKMWNKTKDELFDIYNYFIFYLQERGKDYIVFSDYCRLNGGELVLDVRLISKLFPELEIEVAQCVDCDFEWHYTVWKNGEKIKESVKENECELGKLHIKQKNQSKVDSSNVGLF